MNMVSVLQEAKTRIANKDNWVQGSFAVDKYGESAHQNNDNTVKWCAVGSLHKSLDSQLLLDEASDMDFLIAGNIRHCLSKASHILFEIGAMNVNDQLGHDAVMQVYDLAIQLAAHKERTSL